MESAETIDRSWKGEETFNEILEKTTLEVALTDLWRKHKDWFSVLKLRAQNRSSETGAI